MERMKRTCKIIAIYSNKKVQGKTGYAVNLAASLAKVVDARVMIIDMDSSSIKVSSEIKVDLTSNDINKEALEEIKTNYKYVIVNLPCKIDERVYEVLFYSDTIHFFVASTKESLKDGYKFLEDLSNKNLEKLLDKLKIVVNRLDIFDKFSMDEMAWLIKHDVWALVPEPGILDVLVDLKGNPLVLKNQTSAYTKAVLRIARSEADKLLGLVLGSGAAFGLAHIGVLRVLEQHDIDIDVLSGSSIGGLIAALWGIGLSSDKIERIAKKLRNKLNIMRLLDFTIPVSGILEGKRLKNFLRSILGEKTFEDLKIPVKIVVYDLANRETLSIEKGLLVDAVYMSISVPGIFTPKVEKERVIVDGGIQDPVPVDILLKEGIKKIVAVNVLPSPEDIYKRNRLLSKRLKEEGDLIKTSSFYGKLKIRFKNYLRSIFTPNIFDVIMTSMQSMEYIFAENSCRKADVVLHPVVPELTSTDFHLVKSFIDKGIEETNLFIEKIKKLAND